MRVTHILPMIGMVTLCGAGCTTECTTHVEPAIVVVARDGATGANITDSASGSVTDGSYSDSFRPNSLNQTGVPLSLRAADERPGTYGVWVVRPGYQPVSLTAVTANDGECHVETVSLQVTMTR